MRKGDLALLNPLFLGRQNQYAQFWISKTKLITFAPKFI